MKKLALGIMAAVFVALTATPAAAELDLPAASPGAKVSQTVGVTDISIDYSSPAVKGRKIWGDLVTYDRAWRAGANLATKITFSRDVTFGGKPVPAGTYSIVMFPSAKGWQVALSKELGLWSGGKPYMPKDDVVRVPATTAAIAPRERMLFLFSDTTDDSTSLDMEWEKLRVSVPIKVDTAAFAQANIKAAQESAWRDHANAARYVADTTKDYATALKLADTSVAMNSNWYNQWIRANILASQGNYAEARKAAQTSWDLGNGNPGFFFKDAVAKALVDWKDKK